jgi:hypothetical protein
MEAPEERQGWVSGVEATWEAVKERTDGTLELDEILEAQRRRKRKYVS